MKSKIFLALICLSISAWAQAQQFTDYGIIRSVTPLQVNSQQGRQVCDGVAGSNNNVGRGIIGSVIGGVAGGILGNQVGGGNGRVVATALGALAGGMTGDRIQNNQGAQQNCWIEYVNVTSNNGYSVIYDYNGMTGTANMLNNPGEPGEKIRLALSLMPI